MNTIVANSGENPSSLAENISNDAKKLSEMADTLQNSLARFRPVPIKDFPAAIKAKRKELDMTGQLVAELSGISDTAYRRIEQGNTNPRLETVMAICDTLGLTLCVI
jgi:DNA-binding XRE family transcriptional regulator